MIIFDEPHPRALLLRLDPRVRVIAAFLWTIAACSFSSFSPLRTMLFLSIVFALASGLSFLAILRRVVALNGVMMVFLFFLPLSTPGEPLFRVGSWGWSLEGGTHALLLTLRANTIVLACASLLGGMEAAHLGIALRRLGVPPRLATLFLFMIRYVECIHREYHRLRDAMRLRCFRLRWDLHSLRSLGFLMGMLLVRSAARAERIHAAMRCRGFHGEFYSLEPMRLMLPDLAFLGGILGMIALAGGIG